MTTVYIARGSEAVHRMWMPGLTITEVDHSDPRAYFYLLLDYNVNGAAFTKDQLEYFASCKKFNGKILLDGKAECTELSRNFISRNLLFLLNTLNYDLSKLAVLVGSQIRADIKSRRAGNYLDSAGIKWISTGGYFASWLRDFIEQARARKEDLLTVSNKTCDFVCLNRRVRLHRVQLVAHLVGKLLHVGNKLSFFNYECDETSTNITKMYPRSREALFLNSYYPRGFSVDTANNKENNAGHINWDLYLSSRYSLVTETEYFTQDIFFSEKIFKPIVAFQPFILVGAPGSLAALRSMGVETFGDIFDESYDEEIDHEKRMSKIITEVERFSLRSDNDKSRLLAAAQEKVEHNFNLVFNNLENFVDKYNELKALYD